MSRVSAAEPPPSVANTARSRMRALPPPRPNKRLILCEDGTWQNSDSGSLKSSLTIESNMTRIARAVKPLSSDGIPQVTFYHSGVGSTGWWSNKLYGGITGAGLSDIVRQGYQFLATNYTRGDEIFIFGFSRGAYSARAIAGLIGQIGLLTTEGMPFFPEIFKDIQHEHDPHYVPKHPDLPFPDKPSALEPEYKDELVRRRMTRLGIPIKVIGVFDTVGALGPPKIGWLQMAGVQPSSMKEMSFYDTSLSNCIEHAFQALALDERRFSFQPTLWEKFPGNETILRQVWFPGAHSNVGGGYEDQQMATITLVWMLAQCQQFLDFDLDYVFDQWEDAEDYFKRHGEKRRRWAFGKILDGVTSLYAIGGQKVRTPGRYCAVDPTNGRQTEDPLEDTHEYVHPSVRARIKLKGPGINDHGIYECKALENWKLMIESSDDGKLPEVFWRSRFRPEDGFAKILPEAPLKPLEREILDYDPDTRDYVLRPSGVRQRRSTREKGRRSRSRG